MKDLNEMANEELISLYNSNNDEYVKEFFFEKNINIAHGIANEFIHAHNDINNHDDICSVAYVGMVKAFNTFDPNKEVQFSTYSSKVIRNEILHFLRDINKLNKYKTMSVNEEVNSRNENKHTYEDILMLDVVSFDTYLIINDTLDNFYRTATKREKDIYNMRISNNIQRKEVAKKLGVSEKTVSCKLRDIKARLAI